MFGTFIVKHEKTNFSFTEEPIKLEEPKRFLTLNDAKKYIVNRCGIEPLYLHGVYRAFCTTDGVYGGYSEYYKIVRPFIIEYLRILIGLD